MENSFTAKKGDVGKEDPLGNSSGDGETSAGNDMDFTPSKSRSLAKTANSRHTLVLNIKWLRNSKNLIKRSFLQSIHHAEKKIPRHVVSVDEKYLRHCLEYMHIDGAKSVRCNNSSYFGFERVGPLSDVLTPAVIKNENFCDMRRLIFEHPIAAGSESVVFGSAGEWIVGSIMGSKSMINILKSPLLQKSGALDVVMGGASLNDLKGSAYSDFVKSPGRFGKLLLSPTLTKETSTQGDAGNQDENVNKRLSSASSSNSTLSNQTFSSTLSASIAISQGVLHCTWKGETPHFVFSVDDKREAYVARLSKVKSGVGLDYVYLFHSTTFVRKENEILDNESHLVGKMKVSTSFTTCSRKSKLMETEFVFFSGDECSIEERQNSSYNHSGKITQFRKMTEVFRSKHPYKKRSLSRFSRSGTMESITWDQCEDKVNNPGEHAAASLLDEHLPPNLEMAAVVMRECLRDHHQPKLGGWGLKFLKNIRAEETVDHEDTSDHSACAACETGDCSISIDAIFPAGFHGGPRTVNGGPSSLLERWASGGRCDCGGWDLGCSLTVLKARPSKEEASPRIYKSESCKFCDFLVQGSKHGVPRLRIVNVHDGLYFVQFQSTLSALQSFSVAVAYIHSQSPILRPKDVQDLK